MVISGQGLGEVENGVTISKLLIDRSSKNGGKELAVGDTFVLDRVLTELQVVGIVDEFNIGHVPIVCTPLRKWQEAAYGTAGAGN